MILRKVSFFIFSNLILIISAAKRKNVIERLFDDLFEDADYDENIIPVENAPVNNKVNLINIHTRVATKILRRFWGRAADTGSRFL